MSRCRFCQGEITWARRESGGKLPLEPSGPDGRELFVLRDKLSPEGPLALAWWGPAEEPLFVRHECPKAAA